MANLIQFNQVLHGYKEGHTLIASSLDLPSEVKRIMLPISDMSGGRMLRGFEEYITGYPVKHLHCYAVAKTWYAPEMKRPGCVWTHTILIDYEDVPRLTNIFSLTNLFQRPAEIEPNFKFYDNKILIESTLLSDEDNSLNKGNFGSTFDKLIYNLYEYPNHSILLPYTESNVFEVVFLKIWMQQWPRLKRNFTFCTGAISPRAFMGKSLDLQIIPHQYLDASKNLDYKIIDLAQTNDIGNDELIWVKIASDSLNKNEQQLTQFFNLFGSDVTGDRSAFKLLVKAYRLLIYEKPDVNVCIEEIANLFSNVSDAATLKNYLFGRRRKRNERNLPTYDERAVVYHLAVTGSDYSYDFKKLEFEQRFVEQFFSLKDADIELLKQILVIGPNIHGESAVTKLAESISSNGSLDLLWADKQLSLIFIHLNPRLAYNKRFWEINLYNHLEIVHSLLQSRPDLKLHWDQIIKILIDLRSSIDVSEINLEEPFLVECILNTLNDDYISNLPDNWLRFLKTKENSVLNWLKNVTYLEDKVVEILVLILNPNSPLLIKIGPEKWINYLKGKTRPQLNLISSDIHAFFVALALNSNYPEFNKLYVYSFEIVYYAIARELLSHNSWRRIEVHTKPLGLFKDWDRCKKLINGMVDHFISNSWTIYTITNDLQSPEIRDRLSTRFRKKSR